MTRTAAQIACPIPLHPDGFPQRIPVLRHPTAGFRLVKSAINTGERPETAAARALFDQSGLETRSAVMLGTSQSLGDDAQWHFSLCRVVPPVRDQWAHLFAANGRERSEFRWLALDADLPQPFDPICQRALNWIRNAL